MFVESLAIFGAVALGVSVVKGVTNRSYEQVLEDAGNCIKNAVSPYIPFCLENVSIFLPGLKDIIDKYSSLPFDLTCRFQGSTGTFDYYKFQFIPKGDYSLKVIERMTYNLTYKTLVFAGFSNFKIIVLSDIQSQETGEAIVTIFYAINGKSIAALDKWYNSQISVKKADLVPGPILDDDLEKDLENHGC